MYFFLAHIKILSRMLELGLFDEFFASLEKYTNGDVQAKSYLQECAQAYNININFPRKDKFTKDINFELFFEGIYGYVHSHSMHVLYTLLEENDGFNYYEENPEDIPDLLDHVSDEELKEVVENLDYDDIYDDAFECLEDTIDEQDLQDYTDALPEAKTLFTANCSKDYPFFFYEDCKFLGLNKSSLFTKFSSLNLTAHELLQQQQKNKSNAISATSAHKRRVKKQSAKTKGVTNQVAGVNLGYRLSDDMPLSYFQPSKNADFGFNLVKNIDLFGLHLILVAQRRKYHFETTLSDEYRGDYDAIADIDLSELVSLHDSAVKACQEYQTAYSAAITAPQLRNKCFGAFLNRNCALAEYARYYNEIFAKLSIHSHQINDDDHPWFISKNFFNLNLISEPIFLFCDICYDYDLFYLFTNSPKRALDFMRNMDNKLIEDLNECAPMTIYQACSKFASTFDSIESTHPLVVDFKAIAQKVLNYSQELESIGYLKFPYAIELDNYTYQPGTYHIDFNYSCQLKREYDLDPDKFNTRSKTLKLNCQPNDYVFIFSGLSLLLDAINDYHIQLFAFKTKNQGIPAIFNWYGDNSKDVDIIFPLYEQWRNHPIVAKLADAHKRCFELLVLIMDLKGELRELYQDPYFVTLLKQTDSYDEEFASSLANNNEDDAGDAPKLTKQENVLLNKAIVNFLKTVDEFGQSFFEFTHTSIPFVNEIFAQAPNSFQLFYNSIVAKLNNILSVVYYFSNSLIASLDNVPQELAVNFAKHKQDYENSEINALFYQNIKETIFIFLGKIMCNFARPYSSFWNYQDLASFKKYYTLVCADQRTDVIYEADFFSILGIDRMLTLNPNLDEKEVAKVKQSLVCEHLFIRMLIESLDSLSYQVLCCIGCCLVNYVAKLTTKKSVVAHIDEINVLLSITKHIKSLAPLKGQGISLHSQAVIEHFFLTENDEFREIINKYLTTLKLATKAVLHSDYAEFKLDSLNHENFLVRTVYFLEQLLADPATVLTYINPDAIREHAFVLTRGVYASTAPFYGPVVLNVPVCTTTIMDEHSYHKNTVPVFLTLFGKEFTETFHPRVFSENLEPGSDISEYFSYRKKAIQCKPVVERALNQLLKEVSDESIANALESIDIYQGVDMSTDNWSYEEYSNQVKKNIETPINTDDEDEDEDEDYDDDDIDFFNLPADPNLMELILAMRAFERTFKNS